MIDKAANELAKKIQTVGVWRISVDGAMILTALTVIVKGSVWATNTGVDIDTIKTNQINISRRLTDLEVTVNAMPITREAEARLRVLERTLDLKFTEIEKQLNSLNSKIDRLERVTEKEK